MASGDPATPHVDDVALISQRNEARSKEMESPAMADCRAAAAARRKAIGEGVGLAETAPGVATETKLQEL